MDIKQCMDCELSCHDLEGFDATATQWFRFGKKLGQHVAIINDLTIYGLKTEEEINSRRERMKHDGISARVLKGRCGQYGIVDTSRGTQVKIYDPETATSLDDGLFISPIVDEKGQTL